MVEFTNFMHAFKSMYYMPVSMVNDGLCELTLNRDLSTTMTDFMNMMKQHEYGGISQYFNELYRFS